MPDYKDYVKNRNFDAAGFKEHFGLEGKSESEAYSKGSTTGTKQVGSLGTYMSEDDYNRLKNDDKVWELYAEVNGQEAADKKREGSDGLSINALDGLLDKVSAKDQKALTEGPKEPEAPVSVSPRLAEARTRVKQYEEDVLGGRSIVGAKDAAEQQADASSFLDRYKLKLDQDYSTNAAGDYVNRNDQARYDADMSEYNKKKAEYDAQTSSLGN